MTDEQRWNSLVRRYEDLVIRHEVGCWSWARRVHPHPGYPVLGTGRVGSISAHRLSYRLHVGEPGDQWVLHHCDQKLCTRPDHLYLGDQWDNGRDIRARGTSRKPACRAGHERTPENTYERTDSRGYLERHCLICSPRHAITR